MTFKAGDKIRCIDADGNAYLTLGQILTVSSVDDNYLYVEEKPQNIGIYRVSRFELVKPKAPFKAGDRVRCIQGKSTNSSTYDLTEGKIYTVSDCYENAGDYMVLLKEELCGLFANRFELVKSLDETKQKQYLADEIVRLTKATNEIPSSYDTGMLIAYKNILNKFYGITYETSKETTVTNKITFSEGSEYVW